MVPKNSDRIVYIIGQIDSDLSLDVMTNLMRFGQSKKPILVLINSCGGDAAEALAIHDSIKLFPGKVFGLVAGQCYSAASTILQACTVRMMSPNSRFMIHLGSFSVKSDHAEEALKTVQEEMKVLDVHDQLLASRSGQITGTHQRNFAFRKISFSQRSRQRRIC